MPDPQTLPAMVRAKYPGVYDDLSDADLDAKIRTKYPGVYDDLPKPSTYRPDPTMQAFTQQRLAANAGVPPVHQKIVDELGREVGGMAEGPAKNFIRNVVQNPAVLSAAYPETLSDLAALFVPNGADVKTAMAGAKDAAVAMSELGTRLHIHPSALLDFKVTQPLRFLKEVISLDPAASKLAAGVEHYAPNVSTAMASASLTPEQIAAQSASGHALPPPASAASPVSGPQGVPARAIAPDASARAAVMRAATEAADPSKDVAVVKTLIANGVPPAAAVKQVAGNSPQRYGALMTLYLRSRQVQ